MSIGLIKDGCLLDTCKLHACTFQEIGLSVFTDLDLVTRPCPKFGEYHYRIAYSAVQVEEVPLLGSPAG